MNKTFRLRKNRDFQFVYRRGKSLATPYLVLIYVRNGNNNIKVGFSISKKVGNSVVRNRVKRLMRENFRILLDRVKPGYHYVFVARNAASKAKYRDIEKSMVYLLRKSKLLTDKEDRNNEKSDITSDSNV